MCHTPSGSFWPDWTCLQGARAGVAEAAGFWVATPDAIQISRIVIATTGPPKPLGRAPVWLKRPVSGALGFAGKLATVTNSKKSDEPEAPIIAQLSVKQVGCVAASHLEPPEVTLFDALSINPETSCLRLGLNILGHCCHAVDPHIARGQYQLDA